ncbi:MAG: type I glutamate--ammonia ligase [Dehalococcoidia bacterium]|nr:type I glutamate--ammonia ligase [Dehalococcoidia bacterium]
MTLQELLQLAESRGIRRFDLRITDLPGRWQHFTIPINKVKESLFTDGNGFDGSSLRGFQQIQESDMLAMPDISTAVVDPIPNPHAISLICDVADPLTKSRYSRDPRNVGKKAEEYLRSTGIADTAYFGPELEFFIFDDVRFQQGVNTAFYFVDSEEGAWNSGTDEGPNLGFKISGKEGYSPVPPWDATADIRWSITEALNAVGIETFVDHHEVATGGQQEIGTTHDTLVAQADRAQWYKYLVRNVTRRAGKVATFMPKPMYGDNGSGMHTHQSLWKDGQPLFYDSNGYAGLSQLARWYIGGLLRHAPAVLAFAAPSTNSYRRLVPGYEAPVNLAYSARNRSAAVRIPTYETAPAAKRIEFRPPDPTSNPYLAFSAMLMAGLDGIQKQIDPGDPLDRNIYELPPEEAARVPTVPGSLDAALDALEADHDFLLQGGVFTQDLLDMWLELKREEAAGIRLRPTPYEYELYFNG